MRVRRIRIKLHCIDIERIDFQANFNFVCLFDVLEHIEPYRLPLIFESITRHLNHESKILIIIPYWKYLVYKKVHPNGRPQLIDNPISLDDLIFLGREYQLEVMRYEVLSLYHQYDYAYAQMERSSEHSHKKLSTKQDDFLKFNLKGCL